ncbi:MAG: PadR family transcriptional regulator [Candidatus Aminicenantes bacterium]|nr:PadR family transcriptional regulator [Candidatus Aminicenantes bacterium]
MKRLTTNEEIFLIAIWHLGDEAYGVNIREQILDLTGTELTFGTLYNTLDNLYKKGYVSTRKGEPSPQRGGHNKVFYSITRQGEKALQQAHELHEKLWKGMPKTVFEKGNKS